MALQASMSVKFPEFTALTTCAGAGNCVWRELHTTGRLLPQGHDGSNQRHHCYIMTKRRVHHLGCHLYCVHDLRPHGYMLALRVRSARSDAGVSMGKLAAGSKTSQISRQSTMTSMDPSLELQLSIDMLT